MLNQAYPLIVDNISATIAENLLLFIPELVIVFAILMSIIMDLIPNNKHYVRYIAVLSLFSALIYECITLGLSDAFIFYEMLKIDQFTKIIVANWK